MASHMAAEFLCKVSKVRKPLPALSLNDPTVITAISNDFGFSYIYIRQVKALGKKGDILIIFTTSKTLSITHSGNLLLAIDEAKKLGMDIIFASRHGETTAEIQFQLAWLHEVCQEVENEFN